MSIRGLSILLLAFVLFGCNNSQEQVESSKSQDHGAGQSGTSKSQEKAPDARDPLPPFQTVVWVERHAKDPYPHEVFQGPGVVIRKDDAQAYVAGWPEIPQGPDPAPFSCYVSTSGGDDPTRVAARPVAYYSLQHFYVFAVPVDQLPTKALPVDEVVVAKPSMPVKIAGYRFRKRRMQFDESDAIVKRIHDLNWGRLIEIQPGNVHLRHALLLTPEGKPVGVNVTTENLSDDRQPQLIECARPARSFLSLEPKCGIVKLSVQSSDENGCVLEVTVPVAAPWQQLKNPQLLLLAVQDLKGSRRLSKPEGDVWGPISDSATVVPITRVAADPHPLLASIGGQDRLQSNAKFLGRIRVPRGSQRDMEVYRQFSYELPDGTRRYLRPANISLDARYRKLHDEYYWPRMEAAE